MKKNVTQKKINAFWSWFSSISGKLVANIEDKDMLVELDNRVRKSVVGNRSGKNQGMAIHYLAEPRPGFAQAGKCDSSASSCVARNGNSMPLGLRPFKYIP
jgi:hypothetical protein